jgi:parallel beta-helix repeat protein
MSLPAARKVCCNPEEKYMRHTAVFCTSIATLGLLSAAWLHAGPLNPPAGPVASTYKTLTEVEPRIAINATNTPGDADSLFKITQPGSYYLTGNITGVANKYGIEITASGVTLDLNGFELRGVVGSLDGVVALAPSGSGGISVSVKNGVVLNWGDCGIDFPNISGQAASGLIEGILARGNARHGIALAGGSSIVTRCVSRLNGADGITLSTSSTVSHSVANNNGANGFTTNHSCKLTECVASNNAGSGFSTNSGCSLTACTATFNVDGFRGIGGCTFVDCGTYDNTGTGFVANEGSSITNCVAYRSGLDGISIIEGTVHGCAVTSNTGNGIRASGDCAVIGNSCDQNGLSTADGANILVTGNDTRVEGNRCSDADRGIEVTGTGNIIIRNTCTGNTVNWDIVAGNHYGPIIDRTVVAAPPAVNGNAAAEALGSTHPNANFTY